MIHNAEKPRNTGLNSIDAVQMMRCLSGWKLETGTLSLAKACAERPRYSFPLGRTRDFIGLGSKVVEAFALSDTSSSLQCQNFYHTQGRRQYFFSNKKIFFLVSLLPDSPTYRMPLTTDLGGGGSRENLTPVCSITLIGTEYHLV